MKLSEYLADYLAKGIDKLHKAGVPMDFNKEGLEPIIQQSIKAFESTEDVEVQLVPVPTEVKIPIEYAKEFIDWAANKSFCNSGQHICDILARHLEGAV